MSQNQAAYQVDDDDEEREAREMQEYLAMMQGGETPPDQFTQFAESVVEAVPEDEIEEATEAHEEEVSEPEEIAVVAEVPTIEREPLPVIELIEVNNPDFLSYSIELLDMFRDFVENHMRIPSITYETFCNYLCTCVEVIYNAKANGVSDRNLQSRFVIGMVDKKLAGFFLCYMLPQRMPHISTMDIPYFYSLNKHLTASFGAQINRYKKLWKAKHMQMIATSEPASRFFMRVLKGARDCGRYIFGYRVKPQWIKMSTLQTQEKPHGS